MILINLLPHREATRKRRREAFYVALGASAFAGVVVAAAIYLWYGAQIADQQARNHALQTEIARLDREIKDIATLQEEIAGLRARQQAVEDLQSDRNLPVHLLQELVRQLPEGVYFTAIRQNNATVAITGVAQSNERVSELLRNLSSGTPWLTRPELVEIVAGSVSISPREQRRVANFSLQVQLRRASEAEKAEKAANAASAALPGASAPAAAASAPAATSAAAPSPATKQ